MADNNAEFRVILSDENGKGSGEKTPGVGEPQQEQPGKTGPAGGDTSQQALNKAAASISQAAQQLNAAASRLNQSIASNAPPPVPPPSQPGTPLNPGPPGSAPPQKPQGPQQPAVPPPNQPPAPRSNRTPLVTGQDMFQFAANVAAATGQHTVSRIMSTGLLAYDAINNARPVVQRAGRVAQVALGRASQAFAAQSAAATARAVAAGSLGSGGAMAAAGARVAAAGSGAMASITGAASSVAGAVGAVVLPLAAAAGVVAGFTVAFKAATALIHEQTMKMARFSAQIQYVGAVNDIRDMLQTIRNASKYEKDFARFEDSRRGLGRAWENFKDTWAGNLAGGTSEVTKAMSATLNLLTKLSGGDTGDEDVLFLPKKDGSDWFTILGPDGRLIGGRVIEWFEEMLGMASDVKAIRKKAEEKKVEDVMKKINDIFDEAKPPLWDGHAHHRHGIPAARAAADAAARGAAPAAGAVFRPGFGMGGL